jgi:hypothetical protein
MNGLILELKLPSGKAVRLREPTGADEIASTHDAGVALGSGTRYEWALALRCCLSIDDRALDQKDVTPDTFRDKFGSKDFLVMRTQFFRTFYTTSDEEAKRVEDSKRIVAEG